MLHKLACMAANREASSPHSRQRPFLRRAYGKLVAARELIELCDREGGMWDDMGNAIDWLLADADDTLDQLLRETGELPA